MFVFVIVLYHFHLFFSLQLVLENEFVKKYLQILSSHTFLFFHILAPNCGTFSNCDAFSH